MSFNGRTKYIDAYTYAHTYMYVYRYMCVVYVYIYIYEVTTKTACGMQFAAMHAAKDRSAYESWGKTVRGVAKGLYVKAMVRHCCLSRHVIPKQTQLSISGAPAYLADLALQLCPTAGS